MTFNLFNRLILWFKKIFHIHPKVEYKRRTVEVAPQPEEKSIKDAPPEEKIREVSQDGKKPVDMPLPEKKTTEVTTLPEQRPPGAPSEREPQEPSGEEILTTEPSQGSAAFPAIERETEPQKYPTEEKDTLKPQKPYIKKFPTEDREREPIKSPTTERKMAREEELITGAQRKSPSDENIETEIVDEVPKEKERATSVASPFVEIDLDDNEVYLILPKQQLKDNTVDETTNQVSYMLNLNGKQQEVTVKVTTDGDGTVFIEETRIPLEEPLEKWQVAFPGAFQERKSNCYNHYDKGLYAFVARGNNRGRMFRLYNEDGDINPLPKRVVWVLLHEEFELQTRLGSGDIIEERWIWGKYQPFRIDLSEIDVFVINNSKSGEEKSFTLQSTFRVEGGQLIEDDYKKECPLFTGKTLKIVAPYENQTGWNVWIQNKIAGYEIKENWTGREPLTLSLPDELPCEFGEFQIDICQQDTRIPDETLFFRLMPRIKLNYPKELIIPNPKSGHIPSTISVRIDSDDNWELEYRENREIKVKKKHNFYEIELPSEENTFRFSLAKTSRPESIVNFQITVPRLKWKTSKQTIWNGISQKIERKDLKSGESFYLLIQTNDFDNKYDLLALLEANGQKLQEGKFIRKGMEYSLELNQFFDTIKHNKDELTMRVEIRKVKEEQLVGSIDTLYFEGEPKVPKTIPSQKTRKKAISKISNIQASVKCQGRDKQRKAKGFSKRELICAGIDLKDVRCLNIPYDRRRKSSHSWNVETLKTLKGKYDNYGGR